VVRGADGFAVFDALRRRGKVGGAILQASDLLELNGEDFRRRLKEKYVRRLSKLRRKCVLSATNAFARCVRM
jgi:hypothetical protein